MSRQSTITIGFKMDRSELEALEALMRYRGAASRSDYLKLLVEKDKLAAIHEVTILAKLSPKGKL